MLKFKASLAFFFLFWSVVSAQFPDFGGIGTSGGSGGRSTQSEYVFDPDTFGVFYFYADNPNEEFPFRDSLLDNFQQYDPIRLRDFEYANLGNVGSAHRQLFYEPIFRRGYDIGFHQYDLYQSHSGNTPYYRIKQNAFTRASYSQQGQENHSFKGEYSRNFANGINLSLDYRRMKHQGQYVSQVNSINAFAGSVWYHGKGGRYDGFFSFNSNNIKEQDNGGVDIASFTEQNVAQAFTVPVLLDDGIANVELSNQEYSYTHYLKVIGGPPRPPKRKKEDKAPLPSFLDSLQNNLADSLLQKDSLLLNHFDSLKQRLIADSSFQTLDSLMMEKNRLLLQDSLNHPPADSLAPSKGGKGRPSTYPGKNQNPDQSPFYTPSNTASPTLPATPPKRAVTLAHQISYKRSLYRFSNTNPDTSFYGNFAVHRIGLRHFINHKKLENNFRLSTFKAKSNRTDLQKSQQDLLEVGLSHTLHFIDQEVETSTVSNLFLTGRWHFAPSERLSVRTYAHLGFWDNGGDYRVSGDFYFDFKKAGKLRLGIMSQRFAPSLVQQRIFISGISFWDNDFSKTFETTVSGSYQLPLLKLEVRGQYHLVNNYIYFDSLAMPQQTGEAISIAQLMLKKDFKVWRFHLDNTFILQQNSSAVLRLPKYYLVNSFYYEGYLFKKVFLARFGADLRLNGSFQADRYQAITGQFYLQNDLTAVAYPSLDVFINFKVERFRFFAKWENVLDQTIGDLFYLTALHPQRFFGFRFGISWRFRN